jgi:hypothetical protein
MITPSYVQMMAQYNAEMNRRLYAAAGRLDEAALREDRGAFFGSILATLNHLLWGDRTWMCRFDGWVKPETGIKDSVTLTPDLATLAAERVQADAAIIQWAGRVSQHWLEGDLTWFSNATQSERTAPLSMLVTHLFNHQTHHRGQVHAMLTAAGQGTGDTDLFVVVG